MAKKPTKSSERRKRPTVKDLSPKGERVKGGGVLNVLTRFGPAPPPIAPVFNPQPPPI